MRTILCHYHIFKNSGTSFDTLLHKNFGDKFLSFDGPFPFFIIDQKQLLRILERRSEIIACSSHQIQLPVPVSLDIHIEPVIFLRHPLLRAQSIYQFKRKTSDGTVTAKAAGERDLGSWLDFCFSDPREITHISNAQTRMLGARYGDISLSRRTEMGMLYDIHQALRNLDSVLLLGRTEFFDRDVACFSQKLNGIGLDFRYERIEPQNVTDDNPLAPLEEQLSSLKTKISQASYERLEEANQQDLSLYNWASERLS